MKEISNSTLALLVVAAIVVSVAGTMISLSKLNFISESGGVTGMLSTSTTDQGKANLTVPSRAYINLTDDVIEFGTLDIDITNTSQDIDDWWVARNDGSVNISIEIYSTSGDDQDGAGLQAAGRGPFTSTTTTTGCLNRSSLRQCFLVACYNSTSSWATCNTTYDALPLNAQQGSSRLVIDELSNIVGNNTAWFGANVTVPIGEGQGVKEQNVEFLAAIS